ncbi:hypothetical protein C8R45DRAFT_1043958 [Mycena sanguinolenta]|nr:hypothetical protein C8R45DRAFT_1043958 [Mycena sanguinolenta]
MSVSRLDIFVRAFLPCDSVKVVPKLATDVISRRANNVWGRTWLASLPVAVLGFLPVLINIVLPNPSTFPECRAIHSSPASEIVLLVPCLRATFDAIACIIVYSAVGRMLWRSKNTSIGPGRRLISELFAEGIRELVMIFVIMTIEAVFVRMPSVRAHGRNFIAPFVDSLTAILETRFLLRVAENRSQDRDYPSTIASRRSLCSQSPTLDEDTLYEPEPDSSPVMFAWPPRVVDGLSPIEFAAVSAMHRDEPLQVRDNKDDPPLMVEIQALSVLTPENPEGSRCCAEPELAAGIEPISTQNAPVNQSAGNVSFARGFITADGCPSQLDVPPPPVGGWYLPSGIDRQTLLESVDPKQIESWEILERDGPTSLATLAGDSVDPPHEARMIHSNLADLLNIQRYKFRVCAAEPRITPSGRNSNVFLIGGLGEPLNTAIQRSRVVSAPGITFFIYPPHPQPQVSGFMGTIVGLNLENSQDGDGAALEAIRSAVMVNKRFTKAVFSYCDPLPVDLCPEEMLDDLRDSITIRPVELRTLDQGHRIGYRVYATVRTKDLGAYQAIRLAFRFTKVFMPVGMLGTVYGEFGLCRICRSIDHSASLCPYPICPGWRGPSASTIAAIDEGAREGNSVSGGHSSLQ